MKPRQGGTVGKEPRRSSAVVGLTNKDRERHSGGNLSKPNTRNNLSTGAKNQGSTETKAKAQEEVGPGDTEKSSCPPRGNAETGVDRDQFGSLTEASGWQKVQRKKH